MGKKSADFFRRLAEEDPEHHRYLSSKGGKESARRRKEKKDLEEVITANTALRKQTDMSGKNQPGNQLGCYDPDLSIVDEDGIEWT